MRKLLLFTSGAALLTVYTAMVQPRSDTPARQGTPHPGKAIFDQYCLTCHQADARGVPGLNPPLVKTEWVLGDKKRLIGVLLNGLSEEIEINGQYYSNAMPSHSFLTDAQIADVLTYVRSNFGNQASAVTAEEVAEVRKSK